VLQSYLFRPAQANYKSHIPNTERTYPDFHENKKPLID